MDNVINIKIRNRIATVASGDFIICGNEDYSIVFDFDDEWSGISAKTARFYHNGRYEDHVFSGNTVAAPEFANITHVEVGVFADEITTTPARIPCLKSILCRGGLVYEPPDDVYAQIINLINNSGLVGADGVSVSTAKIDDLGHLILVMSDGSVIDCGIAKGVDGTGVTILGTYESYDALVAAHPTASSGDSYIVEGDLYVWSESDADWINVGNIQGPQGVKGDKGDAGDRGENGADGVGIESIELTDGTGDPGTTDTYTITLSNGSTYTFAVYNGKDGAGGGGSGSDGADGEDGATFTPSVSSDGVLSWTNDKGLTNPDPVNIKGDAGADGEDGFSPTVTVEEITNGHRVTITDAEGTKSFDVMDGVGGSGSGSGDMLKSTYDTDGSGVVDDAEKLGGQPPSYYEVPGYLKAGGGDYSITGEVVTVENFSGTEMNVVTHIEPVQEGSGDPSPDNVRPISGHTGDVLTVNGETFSTDFGKNLANLTYKSSVPSISTGQNVSTISGWSSDYIAIDGNQNMVLSVCEVNNANNIYLLVYDKDKSYIGYIASPTNTDLTAIFLKDIPGHESAKYCRLRLDGNQDTTAKVQLEYSSSVTPFVPYNADLLATTGGMVYGGTLDWNTGELTVEWGLISAYAGETLPGEWISDRDVYTEGATPTTGAQVCYKLATPNTIQLTKQEILALEGTNTIYASAGNVTVSGTRNIFTLIDSLKERIAALEAAVANNA